jgi:hypothetical protein
MKPILFESLFCGSAKKFIPHGQAAKPFKA